MNLPANLPLAIYDGSAAISAIIGFLTMLVRAVLIIGAAYLLAGFVQGIFNRVGDKDKERRAIIRLLGRIVKFCIVAMAVIMAIKVLGFDILPLIAGLGLTGIGLALAFKDLLTSTVAGVVILLSRPFHEGDHISVAGFEGTVLDIDLRYTRLQGEGKEFLVPNSTVMTSPVTVIRNSGVAPGVPEAVKEEAKKQTTDEKGD